LAEPHSKRDNFEVAESLIKKPLTRASSGRSTRDYPSMISDHKHNYSYSIAMHPNRKEIEWCEEVARPW
jgi:hypothetical protein